LASVLERAIPTVTGTWTTSMIRPRRDSAYSWGVFPGGGVASKKN
jgi:hypothetical protein